MFEKEAKEYYETKTPMIENITGLDFQNEVTKAFQKGAEFGYNKANGWHYPSKGENPEDEFSDEYKNPRLPSAYKRFYCLRLDDDYLMGKYIRGLFHTADGLYSLSEIIAWKEIGLPIKPEEEKCEKCIKSDKEIDCHKCDIQNEKHYRPFNNCSELIEYWYDFTGVINCSPDLFMPTIWVKHKRYGTENQIIAFDNDNKSIGGSCVFIQDMWIDMKELFDNFTFLDGSVCGVEE